jgi:hypothetical protein
MKRYIEQLIEDIRRAGQNAPHLLEPKRKLTPEEEFERDMEEVERYVRGEQEKLSDILGIPLSVLPSPDKLTKSQLDILVNELNNLLNAYNFYPDFPENLPDELKYKALLGIWESDQTYMQSGMMHIEFCDYDQENCPFPGYCQSCDGFSSNVDDVEDFDEDMEDDWLKPEVGFADHFIQSDVPDDEENQFIPGIYNYCDRWCERCDFTNRCRNFYSLSKLEEGIDPFKEELRSNFPEKSENDTEDDEPDFDPSEFLNIDPDEMDEMDESDSEKDFFSADQKTERNPLNILADEFSWAMYDWLKIHHAEFEKNLTGWLAKGQADEMAEAFEVLLWYHLFIHVKLKRAINGYYETQDFDDAEYDMNGTAKVSLIAIDRSLDALRILRRYLKQERSNIDQFRAQLEKIRFMTEEMFPEARNFIRPGLDE